MSIEVWKFLRIQLGHINFHRRKQLKSHCNLSRVPLSCLPIIWIYTSSSVKSVNATVSCSDRGNCPDFSHRNGGKTNYPNPSPKYLNPKYFSPKYLSPNYPDPDNPKFQLPTIEITILTKYLTVSWHYKFQDAIDYLSFLVFQNISRIRKKHRKS